MLRSFSTLRSAAGLDRGVIVQLLGQMGSQRELNHYLKHYASLESNKFAVIKVGGGVLLEEMDSFASSLSFLHRVGLTPIVLHGAGPQLNDALKEEKVESDYIGGLRVTTPQILETAKLVFRRENMRLVRALEEKGVRATPIVAGVFEAEPLDEAKYQLVGKVTGIRPELVDMVTRMGHLPILTCMGETASGQLLNVNADIAAHELAKAIEPEKVIYISAGGGLRGEQGDLLPLIDLNDDYDVLMNEPWFKHGDRLKLKEIKTLLDSLPPNASVAITSAQNLPRELFTHSGGGTLVRKQDKIFEYTSLKDVDHDALVDLIEESFGGELRKNYLRDIGPYIHRVFVLENYSGCAIITQKPGELPYLEKFAIKSHLQGDGAGNRLWSAIQASVPTMYWRSRRDNKINAFYFSHSQGTYTDRRTDWTVFWYGVPSVTSMEPYVDALLKKAHDIDRSPRSKKTAATKTTTTTKSNKKGARGFSTTTTPSSSSSSSPSVTTVGLIGARGHTGGELLRILDRHPQLTVGAASSRAWKGKTLRDVVDGLSPQCEFGGVSFEELQPADVVARSDVDVWVLAMPNNLASPFVDAVNRYRPECKLVDLSADYRFNPAWTYGLPERHGARDAIRSASRISNPGCYATGAQLSLMPLVDVMADGHPPHVFGVSGYSGAGTTPSRKNNTNELRDNLMPYSLLGHIHEGEVSHQLGTSVRFMPHVASWFRGIALTVAVQLDADRAAQLDRDGIVELFSSYYKDEPLVRVVDGIPEVRDIAGQHHVEIGGFAYDQTRGRLVVTTTIDNLLKGAATQAVQNMNLALGYPELDGILTPSSK